MEKIDFLVVGGGIVGLAVGSVLSAFGSLAVVEKHKMVIQETSSRNSGVVHCGVYYPPESLKTKLCIKGNANMWRMQGINAKRIGKWIGTSDDPGEEAVLKGVVQNMKDRNIKFEMVPKKKQQELEPLVHMNTVVNSLDTGIVDVHTLADYYQAHMGDSGYVVCGTEVSAVDMTDKGIVVQMRDTTDGETSALLVEKAVVVAMGLHMNRFWDEILRLDGTAPDTGVPAHHRLAFCKGRYVSYRGKPLVHRLVYPCPLPQLKGLGVHSVVDVDGQVRFGPDAVYVPDHADLQVVGSEAERAEFLESQWRAIARYLPSIEKERLEADFCGIRPKLAGPGEPFRDFLVEEVLPSGKGIATKTFTGDYEESKTGTARLVVLNGIESPGLTASSALAEMVGTGLIPQDRYVKNTPPWASSSL